MAWVEKRPAGWCVRWRNEHGKHTGRAWGSKAEAEKAARDFEETTAPARRRRTPGARPVDPLTIAQVAEAWAAEQRDDQDRMRRPGAEAYLVNAVALVTAAAEGWALPKRAARPGDVTVEQATKLRRRAHRTAASMRCILRWGRGHLGTPFDPMVDEALKPPPSRKAGGERLTDRQAKACLARARRQGQLPMISCLMVYGWRPITACRLNVGDVDLKGRRIRLEIKHDGEAWWHPLFPFHVEMLRPLVDGRDADAPLFVPPRHPKRQDGQAHQRDRDRWMIDEGGSAGMLAVWFRRNLLRGVGTKQVKKLAISRMRAGEWPWRRPLDQADVRLYTGQKSDQIVARYEQTNLDRARAFMAPESRGQQGGTGAF